MEPTIILERRVAGLNQRMLAAFVAHASKEVGLAGAVTVMVTGNREMRRLNFRFRGKDQSTDVLSFPPPEFVSGFAGDIAICFDIAARNARTLNHSTAEEVRVLVLHGILHLAGYDHEGDQGEMAKTEDDLRKRLSLPSGLIKRNTVKRRMRSSRSQT